MMLALYVSEVNDARYSPQLILDFRIFILISFVYLFFIIIERLAELI